MFETVYSVKIESVVVATFTDLSAAIREWDARTCMGKAPVGGIEVAEYRDGLMVRDGNILHVDAEGRVYLNPNLAAA